MGFFKAIKASRLKEKELRLELLNAMRKSGRAIRRDFQKTVETWDNKPQFEILISLAGGGPEVLVETNSEIYRYVDQGTEPHIIVPVNASVLAFPSDYTAKTVPGVIDSRSGGPGGDTVFASYVEHPGTKARNFSKTIARIWRKRFKRDMEAAMRRAAAKSGHAL